MSKELKILFIPRWYPNRVDPLNGVFIKRHALAVSQKHRVAVLYVNADPDMKDKAYDLEAVNEEGLYTVRVFYSNSTLGIPLFSSAIKFYRYVKACRMGVRVVKEKFGIPDISHIHVLSRTFVPAYLLDKPIVVSEQWSGYLPEDGMYKGFLKKRLTRMAIRRASAVTTVSESLKKAMLNHGLDNNYSVIPNVVDISLFSPPENIIKKEKFIFLHVSNLDDRAKNVSGMIRALKKLTLIRSDFEFHIVGEGTERAVLEKLAKDLELLGKNIFFLGSKTSSEVAELMKGSDLFLLFSNYDNMPCVMVESMASGLPVIGSSIHGIAEHVKSDKGIVVKPGDETAFCEAVVKAMEGLNKFDKAKMHNYAKEKFSYAAVADQFDAVYQKVIQR